MSAKRQMSLQKVELHLIFKTHTLRIREHVLGVGIIDFRALYAFELVEIHCSWG